MFSLVVTRQFGKYKVGDRITDPVEIAAIGHDHRSVVKVQALEKETPAGMTADAPEPAAAATGASET